MAGVDVADPGWLPYRAPVAVVQPLPGIGDMVWHLPHIRAIAAQAGTAVTLLAKPRSMADQLLAHEPAVSGIIWVDIKPKGRRGLHDGLGGLRRLAGTLRARSFGSVVLLHHSDRLAAAAWMAGIPDRRGYGWGAQRWFLNHGPFLSPQVKTLHQHTRATRYLAAAGIPLPSAEPALGVDSAAQAEAMGRLGAIEGGFVAMGIGSSEALRQWGSDRFGALARALLDAGWSTLVLLGGKADAGMAAAIIASAGGHAGQIRPALGWRLAEAVGLLAAAVFYVGNNTGMMNIAAAVGTRSYGLFGTTAPFDHASLIVPIVVPDTGVHDGMRRLTTEAVLAAIQADRGRLSP